MSDRQNAIADICVRLSYSHSSSVGQTVIVLFFQTVRFSWLLCTSYCHNDIAVLYVRLSECHCCYVCSTVTLSWHLCRSDCQNAMSVIYVRLPECHCWYILDCQNIISVHSVRLSDFYSCYVYRTVRLSECCFCYVCQTVRQSWLLCM